MTSTTTNPSSTRESELLARVPTGLFIGGTWREASGGGHIAV